MTRNSNIIIAPIMCFLALSKSAAAFTIHQTPTQSRILSSSPLVLPTSTTLKSSVDDDITRLLAKSRLLLTNAKAKLAAEEIKAAAAAAASVQLAVADAPKEKQKQPDKRPSVTKSTNAETGLITTDGELMAALSEQEDWELKGLLDVFESEIEDSDLTRSLAKRDVAASIMNLRISMHNDDYRKIFDKTNFFIGEDN